ncbi:MAG: response regulator [bacterium]|nr:response regulator [bacterium]
MKNLITAGRPVEILLVEDDPDHARLAELAFENFTCEFKLHHVCDGDDAISFLRREDGYDQSPRPDIMLLDLNLPGKTGREVLKEMKEDARLRRIPVLILSTSDSVTDRIYAYSFYANGYLTKPDSDTGWRDMAEHVEAFWIRTNTLPPE